jgi:hypothetical protein
MNLALSFRKGVSKDGKFQKALDVAGLEVKDLDFGILHGSAIWALQFKRNWRSLLVKRKGFELRLTLMRLP